MHRQGSLSMSSLETRIAVFVLALELFKLRLNALVHLRRHAVMEEDAIQMVILVLKHTRL